MLATLKIHSAYHKFFDNTEYTADFNNYHDILFYLQSMHSKFNSYIRQLTNNTDESFAFLDKDLNVIPIDSYHIKHIKEGETVYLAPLIVGGGGKRGGFLLLIAAAFAAPMIMGALSAGSVTAAGATGGAFAGAEGGAVLGAGGGGGLFSGMSSAFAKMPSLARSFLGNMALSVVTSLFAKKPKKMETDQSTRQNGMFGNLTNTLESGTPIPLQYGLIRVAGQMLSGYIDSDEHGKNDIVKVEDKF